MSNPILETYKHKATGTVYDLADRDARAAIEGINAVIPVDTSGTNMLVTESELTSELASGLAGKVNTSSVGSANGVAGLDGNGLVPAAQLPSYVDDVLEGTAQNVTETDAGTFAATGFILKGESVPCALEDGKTYVDITSNIQYRWTGSGTNLVSMGSNLTLGETANTAYSGKKGKANADAISAMKDGSSIDSFSDVETALGDKLDVTRIAPEFRDDVAYTTGQYVTRNGFIYRFKNNHSAGAFNPQEVFGVTIGDVLADKEYITSYNSGDFLVVTGEDSSTGYTTNTVSLNKASTPTRSDNKPITSGGVYNYAFPRSEQAVVGAVNLFNTFDAPYVDVGLTVTKNADGTITLGAGTATGEFLFPSSYSADYYDIQPNTDYVFSIGDVDVSGTGIKLEIYYAINNGSWTLLKSVANVNNINFNVPAQPTDIVKIWARIQANHVTLSADKHLKPIISTSLQPYVPYAMTNKGITEQLTPVHTEATASIGTSSGDVSLNEADYKSIVKVGKVVYFNVRFTLNTATGTGDTRLVNLGYSPDALYPLITLRKRQAPYEEVCGLYINKSGEVLSYGIALPPDVYWISGTYICK